MRREFVTSSAGRDVRSGQARLARQYAALSLFEGLSGELRLILDLDFVLGYEHRENGNTLRFEEAPVIFVSIKDPKRPGGYAISLPSDTCTWSGAKRCKGVARPVRVKEALWLERKGVRPITRWRR